MDIISQLGELALASRLKRLHERLVRDVTRIYRELDVDFEARWFPLLYALKQDSPMTVTGLAETLRLTHPAIVQLTAEMTRRGLVESKRDRTDERRRLLTLSAEGLRVVAALEPVWQDVQLTTRQLLESTGCNLLTALGEVEERLDNQEMYERIRSRMCERHRARIEIVDYRPAYKRHFKSLNYEWLEEYFTVEPSDEKILSDPTGQILKKGGAIVFARLDGRVVGTCALMRHSDGSLELTKMAVSKAARRRQVGYVLADAIISRARAMGAKALYLETSERLEAAVRLYEALGFEYVEACPFECCKQRCSIFMKLDLSGK